MCSCPKGEPTFPIRRATPFQDAVLCNDSHVIMKAWQVTLSILYLIIALGFSQECNNEGECDTNNNSNSNNVQSIRLGLEWFTNPDHLPLIVALHHGIFKDFGLDVDLVEPADHWEAEEEILEGRLDVAVTEPLHLAQDAARGKPVIG